MKWKLIGFLLSISMFARAESFRVDSAQQVAAVITSARRDVVLMIPDLRSVEVYNALKTVLINNRLKVRVLTNASMVMNGANRIAALSLLGLEIKNPPSDLKQTSVSFDVQIRVLSGLTERFALIDGQKLMRGPVVGELPAIDQGRTWLITEPSDVERYRTHFNTNWTRAKPWVYLIPRSIIRRQK
jgi:hypothetical protein